jgi:hypothetical protein
MFAALVNAITAGRNDCLMDGAQNVFCLGGPAGLPDLVFTLGGREFRLTGADYMLPNMQISIQLMDFAVPGVDVLILGDMFLRRVYTLFDMQRARVGFGDATKLVPKSAWRATIVWTALAITLMFVTCVLGNIWLQRRRNEYQELHDDEQRERLLPAPAGSSNGTNHHQPPPRRPSVSNGGVLHTRTASHRA